MSRKMILIGFLFILGSFVFADSRKELVGIAELPLRTDGSIKVQAAIATNLFADFNDSSFLLYDKDIFFAKVSELISEILNLLAKDDSNGTKWNYYSKKEFYSQGKTVGDPFFVFDIRIHYDAISTARNQGLTDDTLTFEIQISRINQRFNPDGSIDLQNPIVKHVATLSNMTTGNMERFRHAFKQKLREKAIWIDPEMTQRQENASRSVQFGVRTIEEAYASGLFDDFNPFRKTTK